MSAVKTTIAQPSDRHLAATIGKDHFRYGIERCPDRDKADHSPGRHSPSGLRRIWNLVHHHCDGCLYAIWKRRNQSAFQKYVAEATGNRDFDTANKLVSTGAISMLVLSLIGLIPVALFSQKVAAASGVPAEFLSAAAASIAVLACIYVVSNFGAAFEAIVMGGHHIDLLGSTPLS